ncbi:MAG: cysteine protease [Candidatus Hydrogenedentota bacterium]
MNIHYEVRHRTTYTYSDTAGISYNRAHLQPRNGPRQSLSSFLIETAPQPPGPFRTRIDYFGNPMHYFTIEEPHAALDVHVFSKVILTPAEYIEPDATTPWEEVARAVREVRDAACLDAVQYVYPSTYIPILPHAAQWVADCFTSSRPILAAALDLTARIHREFEYDPTATTLATPIDTVYANKRGVCQDFAQFQIACLRALGIPARYVSGYIRPLSTEGHTLAGAQATHAWLAVYTHSHGWVDLDPTNNVIPCNDHITLAWGRDYDEVSPLRGVMLGGGQQSLTVDVQVRQV